MTKEQVIQRMCLLMSRANNICGWGHAADCICGESDHRKAGYEGMSAPYQNDGAALDEIERLVNAACRAKGYEVNSPL